MVVTVGPSGRRNDPYAVKPTDSYRASFAGLVDSRYTGWCAASIGPQQVGDHAHPEPLTTMGGMGRQQAEVPVRLGGAVRLEQPVRGQQQGSAIAEQLQRHGLDRRLVLVVRLMDAGGHPAGDDRGVRCHEEALVLQGGVDPRLPEHFEEPRPVRRVAACPVAPHRIAGEGGSQRQGDCCRVRGA